MIKKLLTLAAAFAIVLSCAEKEPAHKDDSDKQPPQDQEPPVDVPSDGLADKTFIVSNLQTKTYIDGSLSSAGQLLVKWCADDMIGIHDGVALRKFTMISEPVDASAVFKGRVDESATEFYAIYPYVEDYQLPQQGQVDEFVHSIPSLQTVSADGGVAEGAVYATGKADSDDFITFKIHPAMLVYSPLTDEGAVSFTVEGSDGKKVTVQTAEGTGFAAGKDYYAAICPEALVDGYTATLYAADGSVVQTKEVPGPLEITSGAVLPLLGQPEMTYYDKWVAGEDIIIAGKSYNKSTYGDATLIAAGETKSITAAKGVFFVEPGAAVTYNPGNSVTAMIIIGLNQSARSSMTQQTHFKVDTDGVLAVMNMDINADALTGSTYLFNIYSANTPKSFALDNCSITFPNKHFMYHAKDTWVEEVAFHNCDVKFTMTANDIWLFNVNTSKPAIKLLDFQNNVFWHEGTMASGKAFRITNGSSATLEKFIFKNNTFVNLATRNNATSYLSFITSAAEISGNIFYFDNQTVNGALLQQKCDSVTASDNYYYTGSDVTFNGCTAEGGQFSFTAASASPFSSMDLSTGKFVKTSDYAGFGAAR